MRRREFITLGGAAAAAWPLAARAQQGERIHKIGVIMGLRARDAEALLRVRAFESSWRELGWVEGRNIRVSQLSSIRQRLVGASEQLSRNHLAVDLQREFAA